MDMDRREFLKLAGGGAAAAAVGGCGAELFSGKGRNSRPNILFCVSDDQSWVHAGAYGDKVVKTPNFDRVGREGVLFRNAFCASACCTPSRSAIVTGQEIWRLEGGALLMGSLPSKFAVYPDLLEDAGYRVGYVHKGWGPGNYKAGGWDHNPAGRLKYNKRKLSPPTTGMNTRDYAGNFADFLGDCPADTPFCFWFGAEEPHRRYEKGSGVRLGKRLEDVVVPGFLPDCAEVRSDICDYYAEIEWFDEHLGRMLGLLEEMGVLDNTIIVVTSDNGMPFPRAKGNLYDWGVRAPLAVRWGKRVAGGRVVDDFVSLADVGPTFLEAAGVQVPSEMTGRSFVDVLLSGKSGRVDGRRDRVFTGTERITWCREGGLGYPSRAIRTFRWLYILNYEPGRWPAGDPDFDAVPEGVYGDVNAGPTKSYMLEHKDDVGVAEQFRLCFGKRGAEELYDVQKDVWQVNNLAGEAMYADVKAELRRVLEAYQVETKDPRAEGKSAWDSYEYYYRKGARHGAKSVEQ